MAINPVCKEETDYGDNEPNKPVPPGTNQRTFSLANNQVKLAFEINLNLLILQKFATSFPTSK